MLKINILEIKEPDGSIHYNGAFSKRATDRYSFDTKEWTKNKNPICWHGGLFEHKNNVLTGRYFNTCLKGIRLEDVTVELEEEAYEEMRNNK